MELLVSFSREVFVWVVRCLSLVAFVLLLSVSAYKLISLLNLVKAAEYSPKWVTFIVSSVRAPVLLLSFILLLLLGVLGAVKGWPWHAKEVDSRLTPEGKQHDTLFVLIHGLLGDADSWKSIRPILEQHGDVLTITYSASPWLVADPAKLVCQISGTVEEYSLKKNYTKVVLVGYSIGAVFARKAFLYAMNGTTDLNRKRDLPLSSCGTLSGATWGEKVERIVLLAGTNRGWNIGNSKPLDMDWSTYGSFWVGSWWARFLDTGQLIRETEAGAPFMANLRLDWMRWVRDQDGGTEARNVPHVVQLLGDIDDVVNEEDSKDIRVAASDKFTWIRVRGTGHRNILNMSPTTAADQAITEYRKSKFLHAIHQRLDQLRRDNDELPYHTDNDVTHLVFVLHGIRDLGQWSSQFETELLRQFRLKHKPSEKLIIASVRYGYFGMGPFVLRADRQKYVRWFMDEYTETLAKYPRARQIDFVGHSNGTYLLASALEQYVSLKVRNVLFAGSVVRKNYDWSQIIARDQISRVRNYVALDDWVVALFPRLFEEPFIRWVGNDIGSAGYQGFDQTGEKVENIKYIRGSHSAFLKRVPEVSKFILSSEDLSFAALQLAAPAIPDAENEPDFSAGEWILRFVSTYLTALVWISLVGVIIWLGARVTGSATQPASIAFVVYILIVLSVLRAL